MADNSTFSCGEGQATSVRLILLWPLTTPDQSSLYWMLTRAAFYSLAGSRSCSVASFQLCGSRETGSWRQVCILIGRLGSTFCAAALFLVQEWRYTADLVPPCLHILPVQRLETPNRPRPLSDDSNQNVLPSFVYKIKPSVQHWKLIALIACPPATASSLNNQTSKWSPCLLPEDYSRFKTRLQNSEVKEACAETSRLLPPVKGPLLL